MNSFETYLCEVFGIDANTSATIIITIIVFGIGQLFVAVSNLYNGYVERSSVRKMFRTILLEARKLCNKQSAVYRKTSVAYKNINYRIFEIDRSEYYHLELLNQIGFDKTYRSLFSGFENVFSNLFCKKKRIRTFIRIWEILNLVDYWEQVAFKDANEVVDLYNKYNESRNEALLRYQQAIESRMQQYNMAGGAPSAVAAAYMEEIDAIHAAWQKTPNRTLPRTVHKKLIIPARIVNRQYIKALDFVYPLNNHLLDASHHYESIYQLFNAKSVQFGWYSSSFSAYRKQLDIAVKII